MKIGVMDSGSGGVSVLAALIKNFPNCDFVYIGDSAAFPYSIKSQSELEKRAEHLTQQLLLHGCQLIVIACNTLTVTTLAHLRTHFPQIPFVGTVPAVAEAARSLAAKSFVVVLATAATAQSEYLQNLLKPFATQLRWEVVATTELVMTVENNDTKQQTAVLNSIKRTLTELPSGIVIGCTHFTAAKPAITAVFGSDVQLYEPQAGICKQVARIGGLVQSQLASNHSQSTVIWLDTGTESQRYAQVYERLTDTATFSKT